MPPSSPTGDPSRYHCSASMVLLSCPSPTRVSVSPLRICHIFDEFRQVERQGGEQTEGTGLGLAIAKKTGTCWEGHSRHRARSVWARRLRCESVTTGADIQGQSIVTPSIDMVSGVTTPPQMASPVAGSNTWRRTTKAISGSPHETKVWTVLTVVSFTTMGWSPGYYPSR